MHPGGRSKILPVLFLPSFQNYVKGGSSKKILFYTTALLIVVGVVQSTRWFYVRAFPQKN